jgi:hypothetical protein
MSDVSHDGIERLSDPPSAWLSTLGDLTARVAGDSPAETALAEWFSGRGGGDRESAVRRLRWLATVGVLTREDGTYGLGDAGRALCGDGNSAPLSAALESNVAGFETVLDALGVRPLTDVEVADLLEQTDAEAGPRAAERCLSWLEALGYLERADGLNELTAAGRERSGGRAGLVEAGGAGPETEGTAGTPARADAESNEKPGASREATADDGPEERDAVAGLKSRYDHACMLCGDRRRRSPAESDGFAEIHYALPVEEPHDGPETPENALVVCPNHRADLEHGLVRVDPRTLTVRHAYEPSVTGRTLSVADGHRLERAYLAYHNDVVAAEFE